MKTVKLKDISINNRGYYGIGASAVDYDKNKFTYLRITDINDDGSLNKNGLMSVDDEKSDQYLLEKNDIVFARTGASTGRNYFYDGEINNMVYAGFLIKFSLNPELVNPKFVKYYCLSQKYKDWISFSLTGSTRPNINEKQLSEMPIELPDRFYQDKVVKTLDSIAQKIQLNNETNNNLSEQLKMIFYEWFESKMDDNLPDDWKIVDLQDVATFSQGVQVPIEEQIEQEKDGFVRFIRIVDITQGSGKEVRFIEDRDRGHVVENEIFMTRYGTPGILSRNYNGIIANNLFKITPSDGVTSNYLFSALNVDRIQKYIKGNATSSTMPAISFSTLNNQKVIIPDRETIGKFDEYSETVRKKQLNIINENKRLERLRDTLLPKLMNGEIDLDNIEI